MSYKDKLYARYVSTHNLNLYGARTLGDLRAQFAVWDRQYGRFLPENKNTRAADLGCGEGGLVLWLRERGYADAEGVDVSGEQIELGRKLGIKGLAQGDLLEFLRGRRDQFDLLFIRDTLGHFSKEEILDILEAIRGALRPGGEVVIKVPNAESPMTGRLRYGDFTHDVSLTGQSLHQLLAASGFKDIRTYSMRPVPHGIISGMRFLLWLVIELKLRLYRLIEAGTPAGHFTQNVLASGRK